MKKFLLIIFLASTFSLQAQTIINNYKYIIVPEKFSFLKKINQYNLNALTKSLFEEQGFTVYYDNLELPSEITNDKCKALAVDIEEHNSMFSTNITLLLKDCKGALVLKSKEGKSREKEYPAAYSAALREAFASLNDLNKIPVNPVTEERKNITVEKIAPIETVPVVAAEIAKDKSVFQAKKTSTGYLLTNFSTQKTFTLFKTSLTDCYLASTENGTGIVFKKNGKWFYEHYENGALLSDPLNLDFNK